MICFFENEPTETVRVHDEEEEDEDEDDNNVMMRMMRTMRTMRTMRMMIMMMSVGGTVDYGMSPIARTTRCERGGHAYTCRRTAFWRVRSSPPLLHATTPNSRIPHTPSTQQTKHTHKMVFYGQPWFLSIFSGFIAVLIHHCVAPSTASDQPSSDEPVAAGATTLFINRNLNAKTYLGVFLVVAVLVYGSFLVAESTGNCRMVYAQPDIQTGGRPPF